MSESLYSAKTLQLAVSLEISELLDCHTGIFVEARGVIGTDYEKFIQLRNAIQLGVERDDPLYRCAICGVSVRLIAPYDKGAHFRHILEDGRCPAHTNQELTREEILQRKYNGAKESVAHQRMKQLINISLKSDPRFSEIEIEKRWTSSSLTEWRKPDVQARYEGKKFAFEAQLSTTFLDVIVQRRDFYQRNGGHLIWIFKEFPEIDRRMTLDDVFYNNNRNAFLITEETTAITQQESKLHLECRWLETRSSGGAIQENWRHKIVAFDELCIDGASQRIWFCDCDKERQEAIEAQDISKRRRLLISFCDSERDINPDERSIRWEAVRASCASDGICFPIYSESHRLIKTLCLLFSMQEARPVGFRYPTLINVAHHAFDKVKYSLLLFGHAIKAYKREDRLDSEDKTGKWRHRRLELHRRFKIGDVALIQDTSFYPIMKVIFPELQAYIDSVLKRQGSATP